MFLQEELLDECSLKRKDKFWKLEYIFETLENLS